MYDIHDTDIADWVNNCPTHKIEVLHSDECGIQLVVRFHNEPDEDAPRKPKLGDTETWQNFVKINNIKPMRKK